MVWEFPGSPVVRTLPFHCQGHSSIPCWGTKSRKVTEQLSLIIEHLASWGWGIALCMIPYHSASQIICEPP